MHISSSGRGSSSRKSLQADSLTSRIFDTGSGARGDSDDRGAVPSSARLLCKEGAGDQTTRTGATATGTATAATPKTPAPVCLTSAAVATTVGATAGSSRAATRTASHCTSTAPTEPLICAGQAPFTHPQNHCHGGRNRRFTSVQRETPQEGMGARLYAHEEHLNPASLSEFLLLPHRPQHPDTIPNSDFHRQASIKCCASC